MASRSTRRAAVATAAAAPPPNVAAFLTPAAGAELAPPLPLPPPSVAVVTLPLCTRPNHRALFRDARRVLELTAHVLPAGVCPQCDALRKQCSSAASSVSIETVRAERAVAGGGEAAAAGEGEGEGEDEDSGPAHHTVQVQLAGGAGVAVPRAPLPPKCTPPHTLSARALRDALRAPKPVHPLVHQAAALTLFPAPTSTSTSTLTSTAAAAATATPASYPHTVWLQWSMGSGKTKGALMLLAAAQACGALPRDVVVWIVCSNTLVEAWASEAATAVAQPQGTTAEIHVVGETEWSRLVANEGGPRLTRGAVVLVDEAHNYRNLTDGMLPDVAALRGAALLLLLSGTPLVNDVDDVRGVLALTGVWPVTAARTNKLPSPSAFRGLLDGAREARRALFLSYDPRADAALAPRFPHVTRAVVRVPMTWSDALHYVLTAEKNPRLGPLQIGRAKTNAFDVASRLACNTPAKAAAIAAALADLPKPCMVHSAFRERGSDMVRNALAAAAAAAGRGARALRHAFLVGDTPTEARATIVSEANRGVYDVLLTSEASHEGVDLKGFRSLIKVEVAHNIQSERQTDNRIVRLDSLPRGEGVIIQQFISTFPPHPPTADEAAALRAHVRDVVVGARFWCEPYVPRGYDPVPHLVDAVHALVAGGGTLDERLLAANERKHAALGPYLDALTDAAWCADAGVESALRAADAARTARESVALLRKQVTRLPRPPKAASARGAVPLPALDDTV